MVALELLDKQDGIRSSDPFNCCSFWFHTSTRFHHAPYEIILSGYDIFILIAIILHSVNILGRIRSKIRSSGDSTSDQNTIHFRDSFGLPRRTHTTVQQNWRDSAWNEQDCSVLIVLCRDFGKSFFFDRCLLHWTTLSLNHSFTETHFHWIIRSLNNTDTVCDRHQWRDRWKRHCWQRCGQCSLVCFFCSCLLCWHSVSSLVFIQKWHLASLACSQSCWALSWHSVLQGTHTNSIT